MTASTQSKPLQGLKIAVLVESKYIPEEIRAYQSCFGLLGAEVVLLSRLWYGDYKPAFENFPGQADSEAHKEWKHPVFVSDVDPSDQEPWEGPLRLPVDDYADVNNKKIKITDYAAILMSANYTSVRLRYSELENFRNARELVQSAPVVQFFAAAMGNKNVVKGALCHGLWILTPNPALLKDRKVTCNVVMMADILNAGADVVLTNLGGGKKKPADVVVDDDLITAYSKHQILPYIEAITEKIKEKREL